LQKRELNPTNPDEKDRIIVTAVMNGKAISVQKDTSVVLTDDLSDTAGNEFDKPNNIPIFGVLRALVSKIFNDQAASIHI